MGREKSLFKLSWGWGRCIEVKQLSTGLMDPTLQKKIPSSAFSLIGSLIFQESYHHLIPLKTADFTPSLQLRNLHLSLIHA